MGLINSDIFTPTRFEEDHTRSLPIIWVLFLPILRPWSQPFIQTCSSIGLLAVYGLTTRGIPSSKASSPSAYARSLCSCVISPELFAFFFFFTWSASHPFHQINA